MKRLSIIIPVYNEKDTIAKLIEAVESVNLPDIDKEIIIIDDNSTDGTRDVLIPLQNKYRIFFVEKNTGKGAAVTLGFQEAKGDYLIIQDADLEYDPNDYLSLLEAIIDDKADVVYGSRFITVKPHRVLYFWHSVGNRLLTLFSNMITNLTLTDMETCYKAFNRKAIDYLKTRLTSNRFGIEPEITALIAKNRALRVYEVGISYFGRTYQEGKKINWKDGVAAFFHIIKFNLLKR